METEKIKTTYNELVGNKLQGRYEENRWFRTEQARAGYEMTKDSITRHLLGGGFSFKSCLELGPGPGTWTKILLRHDPEASFDLVDISSEMLKLAQDNLAGEENINFFEADFSTFVPGRKYDLFFSSRAFEYLPDKEGAAGKIMALLENGGRGFMITKTPKYWRYKIIGRKIPEMHRGQISPSRLKDILGALGAGDIEIFPAIIVVPVFRWVGLNKLIYRFFRGMRLNFLSGFVSESYAVSFKKI